MGHSRISVTIPDEIYNEINTLTLKEHVKLSHFVTEALIEKLRRKREVIFIEKVNEVFKDTEVQKEQRHMAELIADNTEVQELPW
jgi:metal-responsive CopG/Arc/MetJ family transcriptional regulator